MTDLALSIRGLGRRYRRSTGMGLDLFRRQKNTSDWFWALRDISFDVERGTGVGIIGGNGAGKSTLLKILARIVPPSEGEAEICGRVNSLLEVGTGFQPDLSGRANIYLNASILGMSRVETDQVFDEIVAFSGVGDFIDMPVKHYSSGMYSRLAFSVAANVTGDILLVDEVLSVGDAEFRKKCMKRMNSLLTAERRTVLFVSHSMDAVMRFCSHALWLDHGAARAFGPAEEVVSEYLRSVNRLGGKYVAPGRGKNKDATQPGESVGAKALLDTPANGEKSAEQIVVVETSNATQTVKVISTEADAGFEPAATIYAVTLLDGQGRENDIVAREESLTIVIDCEVRAETHVIHPVLHLFCAPRGGIPEETHVFTCIKEPPLPREIGHYRIEVTIPSCLLTTGKYIVSVALVTKAKPLMRHCKLERVLRFQVVERVDNDNIFLTENLYGVIQPSLAWRVRILDPEEVFS